MRDRRRSIGELATMAQRIIDNLRMVQGTADDVVLWINIQNDIARLDIEAAARRDEWQEKAH